MRAMTGGQGKPLVLLSNIEQIPGVDTIKGFRVRVIYVRPIISLTMVRFEILI